MATSAAEAIETQTEATAETPTGSTASDPVAVEANGGGAGPAPESPAEASPDDGTVLGGKDTGEAPDAAPAIVGEAPEAYDVKAPEGSQFDAEVFTAIQDDLKGLGFTNDGAQKLVDLYASKVLPKMQERAQQEQDQRVAALRKAWHEEAAKDAEIGGANWEKSQHTAARVLDTFAAKDPATVAKFKDLMNESGMGNHPDMLRMFVRIGAAIGEDSFERGEGASEAPVPIWDRIYGKPVEPAAT